MNIALPGILLCLLIGMAVVATVGYTLANGSPPMPTSVLAHRHLLSLLDTITPKRTFYELGSGWGQLSIAVARRFPSLKVVGVENSPFPYICAQLVKLISFSKNVQFVFKNFFVVPIHDADIVYCYLSPQSAARVKRKMEEELSPGTHVLSNTFAIPGWTAEKIYILKDIYRTKIYRYTIAKDAAQT
jgi:trans-aconitate methyltransferase